MIFYVLSSNLRENRKANATCQMGGGHGSSIAVFWVSCRFDNIGGDRSCPMNVVSGFWAANGGVSNESISSRSKFTIRFIANAKDGSAIMAPALSSPFREQTPSSPKKGSSTTAVRPCHHSFIHHPHQLDKFVMHWKLLASNPPRRKRIQKEKSTKELEKPTWRIGSSMNNLDWRWLFAWQGDRHYRNEASNKRIAHPFDCHRVAFRGNFKQFSQKPLVDCRQWRWLVKRRIACVSSPIEVQRRIIWFS